MTQNYNVYCYLSPVEEIYLHNIDMDAIKKELGQGRKERFIAQVPAGSEEDAVAFVSDEFGIKAEYLFAKYVKPSAGN